MKVLHGLMEEQLKSLLDNSVDSIVTDPPYGISFMNKKWDYQVPTVNQWKECLRVLKHGGHMLVACSTRTQHRMVCNIEDAGFEVRDVISWIYGSGFPKSHNISKAIDKAEGKLKIIGKGRAGKSALGQSSGYNKTYNPHEFDITEPNSDEAKKYEGWGTALKPAQEFWTLVRKPLSEKTIAKNVLKWGTGGINIDACRIKTDELKKSKAKGSNGGEAYSDYSLDAEYIPNVQGRFPANLIHDGSEEVISKFPITKSGGGVKSLKSSRKYVGNSLNDSKTKGDGKTYKSSEGSASRFFYCPKVSKKERGEGNDHPTVKPIALMEYLITLITPTEGIVLDPFAGSGSTALACLNKGFDFILCEADEHNVDIINSRIENHVSNT